MSMTRALGDAVGAIGKLNGGITKLHPGLAAVKLGLGAVKAALDRNAKFLDEGVKINERLLITNQTYSQLAKEQGDALKNNTAGFAMSSKILTEANILGLTGNSLQRRNLVEAVGRMKITGQNTKAMLDLALKTEQMTLADAKSSEFLAKAITSTAAQYGIAAEKIVKAVGDLDFTMQTAAGFSPENIQNLVVGITGESQQRGEVASQVLNAVSQMDLGKAIALGIDPQFKQLREGTLTRDGFERMMDTLEGRLGFGSIAGMRPEMVRDIFGIEAGLQAQIRAERQLAKEGPTREKGTFDGIAASLAAQEQRANSETERQAAMMESQLMIKEASILANGFLNKISMVTVGALQEAAIKTIGQSKIAQDSKDAINKQLDKLNTLEKLSNEYLQYSEDARKADLELVNSTKEGVRIQEQEQHLRELERSERVNALETMMSARLNDNSEALLTQILNRIGDQVAVAESSQASAEMAEAHRMLRSEAGDG